MLSLALKFILALKFRKTLIQLLFTILSIYLFHLTITPIPGDVNGHSQLWWPDGDTTVEGRDIENLISLLNLSQLISEPTNFEPNKNPSCIDLVITDQPNLVLDRFILSPSNNLL